MKYTVCKLTPDSVVPVAAFENVDDARGWACVEAGHTYRRASVARFLIIEGQYVEQVLRPAPEETQS